MKKEIYILKELHQPNDNAPYCYVNLYHTLEDAQKAMTKKFYAIQDEWNVDEDEPKECGTIYKTSATLWCGYYIDWSIDVEEMEFND